MKEIEALYEVISQRKETPKVPEGRTDSFLKKEPLYNLGKVVEEAAEVVQSLRSETRERQVAEFADLLYFLEISMVQHEVGLVDTQQALMHAPQIVIKEDDEKLFSSFKAAAIDFMLCYEQPNRGSRVDATASFLRLMFDVMENRGITKEEVGYALLNN